MLIPDIMGLRPLFDDHAQRLADDNGWAVAAVEPWPGREDLPLEDRLQLVGTIDDQAFLADLVAAADLLEVEPVGITGFCMGGMFTLQGRRHRTLPPGRRRSTGCSRCPITGRARARSSRSTPCSRRGACPTMAIVGTVDQWTPPADVAAAEAAGVTVVRYEGADHGFVHDDSRPAHRADDAADAWQQAIAFLSE